jgi:hypothetical protein
VADPARRPSTPARRSPSTARPGTGSAKLAPSASSPRHPPHRGTDAALPHWHAALAILDDAGATPEADALRDLLATAGQLRDHLDT